LQANLPLSIGQKGKERKKERKVERRFGFERGCISIFTNFTHKNNLILYKYRIFGKWDEAGMLRHPESFADAEPGQARRNAKDARTQDMFKNRPKEDFMPGSKVTWRA